MVGCENGRSLGAGAVFQSPLRHDQQSCMVITYFPGKGLWGTFTARRIFYGSDGQAYIALRPEQLPLRRPPLVVDYWTPRRIREAAQGTCLMASQGYRDQDLREAVIKAEMDRLDLEMSGPKPRSVQKNKSIELTVLGVPKISPTTRNRWLKG